MAPIECFFMRGFNAFCLILSPFWYRLLFGTLASSRGKAAGLGTLHVPASHDQLLLYSSCLTQHASGRQENTTTAFNNNEP